MPVARQLLDILVCPDCREKVLPTEDDAGLECSGCGRVYPVRDGIPVMLVDEATPPRFGAGSGEMPENSDT